MGSVVGYGFNAFQQLTIVDVLNNTATDRSNSVGLGSHIRSGPQPGEQESSTSELNEQDLIREHSLCDTSILHLCLCWSYALHLNKSGRLHGFGFGWYNRHNPESRIPEALVAGRFSHLAASDDRIACVCSADTSDTSETTQRIITCTVGGSYTSSSAQQHLDFELTGRGRIVQIAVCGDVVYTLVADGSLWSWDVSVADAQIAKIDTEAEITCVVCGLEHVLLLTRQAEIMVMGSNRYGQLGLGYISKEVPTPTTQEALQGVRITAVATGAWHSMALSADGDVYTWGNGADGQLGRPTEDTALPGVVDWPITKPVHVANNEAGPLASKRIKLDDHAALPVSIPPKELTDTLSLSDVKIVTISAGRSHSVAVDATGRAWGFGSDKHGQLGGLSSRSTEQHTTTPSKADPDTKAPQTIESLREDCTERDTYHTPRVVELPEGNRKVQHAVCGAWNTVLICS